MGRLKMKLGGALAVILLAALTACGSIQLDNEDVLQEIDPPQEIEFADENEEVDAAVENEQVGNEGDIGDSISDMDGDGTADEKGSTTNQSGPDEKGGAASNTVMREIYLIDRKGFVSPQTFPISQEEGEIESIIQHLVHGGPITKLTPNGFQAVLPSGTEILGVNVVNGVATIDFSEQFADYHSDQELQVIQALTWSVTQLDGINRVKLKMNGKQLNTMPKNGTPISLGYTRAHGINLEMDDVEDITNTSPAVVYFLAQADDYIYYVPVTRRIPNGVNTYEAVVNELVKGPKITTPLLNDFRREVKLLEEPRLSNGTVTLNFNEALLSMMGGTALSEDVLNMLVLSLTEQQGVEDVSIQVENNDTLLVSSGESLTKPVSRPKTVNTGQY